MYQQMMNERHLMMAHIKNTLDSKSMMLSLDIFYIMDETDVKSNKFVCTINGGVK